MASKVNVTLNALLVLIIVSFANVIKLPRLTIDTQTKRTLGYSGDSLLNFTELTAQYGYTSEEHKVVTEDGYILTVFRMAKPGRNRRRSSRPVILMHGLLQSSDAWLDAGPGAGLAYLLADAGHDLWVGNIRGNYYSRAHTRLDPDAHADYWKFSVDEIGMYDVPAIIEHVLQQTRADAVSYVGFSQGVGAFLVMCSERPGYCDKTKVLIALAPASRQTNTRSIPYRTLTESINALESVLYSAGIQEVFSKGALSQEFLAFLCHFNWVSEWVCGTAESLFDSFHPGSINPETLRVLFGHFPAGTSVHNMARYGQSMQSEYFEKFDYGKRRNLEVYGSERPPAFNLSAVTVPVVALYGENDFLVDERDVRWMLAQMPNVLEAVKVNDPLWNHLDVTYSQMTRKLLFPKMNEYLLKYTGD
ncbi:lipase 1-like [Battus philenor]|uniref:lipase 1-like n=1 Tax=Battus philenor TaxID=42288 RepID=UPI0035CF7AC5